MTRDGSASTAVVGNAVKGDRWGEVPTSPRSMRATLWLAAEGRTWQPALRLAPALSR